MTIDLNCDVGEGMTTDAQIIPLISSANIACGFHAGDASIMRKTIELCLKYDVAVGAHPSWPDKEHFGRTEMQLSTTELYDFIAEQLKTIQTIAFTSGAKLHHVKPHGALYNQSAKDEQIAGTIAKAIKDFDPSLIVYGLSGSISIIEAAMLGLKTAHEVFADRTYMDDGFLTPRSQYNALIEDKNIVTHHALQIIKQGVVTTTTGKRIHIKADTICLHGDGKQAFPFCKLIHQTLKQNRIEIKTIV